MSTLTLQGRDGQAPSRVVITFKRLVISTNKQSDEGDGTPMEVDQEPSGVDATPKEVNKAANQKEANKAANQKDGSTLKEVRYWLHLRAPNIPPLYSHLQKIKSCKCSSFVSSLL